MKRVNLSLSDADFLKLERVANANRATVGGFARSFLMLSVDSKLREYLKTGYLEEFEQVELFKTKKGGKK